MLFFSFFGCGCQHFAIQLKKHTLESSYYFQIGFSHISHLQFKLQLLKTVWGILFVQKDSLHVTQLGKEKSLTLINQSIYLTSSVHLAKKASSIKLPVAVSEANSLVGLLNIFKEVEQGQNHIVYKTAGHIQFINLEFVSWTRICWKCDLVSRGPL